MKKKKVLVIFLGIVLLLVGVFLLKGKKKTSLFEITPVKKGDLLLSVSASGEIRAEEDVTLKFQTSGYLIWVGVKKGDWVKKWQAIASLDKKELEKKFKKEMNDFMNERWDFEQTQDDYKTVKERYLITDAIKRILEKAQFDLENAVLDAEIADLAVKFATIYSPIEGEVVFLDVPYAGVNITPATATFRIVNPKTFYFEAEIDETEVTKIKVADYALIALDAFQSQVFEGNVSRISLEATTTSGGGTAYLVKIEFKDSFEGLRLGMNGDASILGERIDNTLLVPVSALVERGEKNYLWKTENKKAKKVEVERGIANDEEVQILSGVSEGDLIVSSNLSRLKEGMKILP